MYLFCNGMAPQSIYLHHWNPWELWAHCLCHDFVDHYLSYEWYISTSILAFQIASIVTFTPKMSDCSVSLFIDDWKLVYSDHRLSICSTPKYIKKWISIERTSHLNMSNEKSVPWKICLLQMFKRPTSEKEKNINIHLKACKLGMHVHVTASWDSNWVNLRSRIH